MRKWQVLAVAGVAGLAILGGCSNANKPSSGSTTTSGSSSKASGAATTTTATPSAPKNAADAEALAAKALILLQDLPSGWTANGSVQTGLSKTLGSSGSSQGGQGTGELDAKAGQCLGGSAKTLLGMNLPEAQSPSFSSPDQKVGVEDSVDVFPSSSDADQAVSTFASTRGASCVQTIFSEYAASPPSTGTGSSTTSTSAPQVSVNVGPSPGLGDLSGVLTIKFSEGSGGGLSSIELDVTFIAKGPLFSAVSVSGYSGPPSASVISQAARAAAGHMDSVA
jgi:hypothetical protein